MMSKEKEKNGAKSTGQWKPETLREERRNRLAELKSRDGGKKPLQQKSKKATVISILVIAVAVLVVGGWMVNRMGIPHRHLTAMTINEESISPAEVTYHYRTVLNSYGIDPNDPEGQAALDSPSGMEDGQTVKDFVIDMALEQVKESVILSQYAQDQEIELSIADEAHIAEYFDQIEMAAAQADMSLNQYLAMAYGTGMNQDVMEQIISRSFLSEYAIEHRYDQFDITNEQVEQQYEAESDRYDVVDYRVFYVASEAESGASSAERTQAMEEAEQKARTILNDIEDEETFMTAAMEHAPQAEQDALTEGEDPTLFENKAIDEVNPNAVARWVFAQERRSDDYDVVESTTGYYLVYFIDRNRPEYDLVNVRHILISANEQTADEAAIDAAEAEAESILAAYREGEATEEAFADLAREHSDDGNAQRGGIYYNVNPGQMVEPFDTWSFDTARQPGDTDIVQTQFGFHVMYFVDWSGSAWEVAAMDDLRGEAFAAYLAEEKEQLTYSVHSMGMRFVD